MTARDRRRTGPTRLGARARAWRALGRVLPLLLAPVLAPVLAACGDCGRASEPATAPRPSASPGLDAASADAASAAATDAARAIVADAGAAADARAASGVGSDAASATGHGPVRFIAVGDTGLGSARQRRVGAAMADQCRKSGCDFVVMLGDNVYPSGLASPDDPRMRALFEEPYAGVDAPFYPTLGNHDFGGNGSGDEFERGQYEVDYTRRSQKWKLPAAYHHFTVRGVELFDLETNSAMFGRDATQRREMRGFIAGSKAPWKIAFGHHPYLSNGPHGNAGSYEGARGVAIWSGDGVKSYLDGEICGKVDLYLAGHDHSLQWLSARCAGTELIVSGAGSGPTSLPGANPTHFQSLELGFVYIVVEGRALTAEFIDTRGAVMFTRTIQK
ncbi:MAG: metallophosphoesterase [Myxococcales bacterium]|nr:metallophosphoesterase [Myxococcales bacterium]MBL0197972.1 metallophosphoesterase [Myxococcales bacterium]